MSGPYEWDEEKDDRNRRVHGVAFAEAVKVFDDPGAVEEYDAGHSSDDEARYSRIGFSGTHARKADRIMERIYAKQQTG